ncbi:protein kinase C beta type-like isoform X1 [Pseudophryne corroboree]|uniref:protein kinase C beta type-like isoform X1 n=1 Tax=Pseudophryne corroboree TaxID=495146 RepID=UPI0030815688
MEKSSIAAHADEEEHKIFSKRMDKKRKLPSSWEQEERETGDVERRSEGRCGEKGSRAEVEDGGRSKKRRKSKTSAACAQDRAGISNTQPSCLRDDVSLTIRRLSFYHQIGRGSFGKVLLAADARGGPDLAVKIISKRDLLMEGREQALVESRVLELAAGSDFLIHAHFALQTKVPVSTPNIPFNLKPYPLLNDNHSKDVCQIQPYHLTVISGCNHLQLYGRSNYKTQYSSDNSLSRYL